MRFPPRFTVWLPALIVGGIALAPVGSIAADPAAAPPAPAAATATRDGQHDFDFNIGTWRTHIKRILDPFSGSADSIELNGTVSVRKVWDGRAQLEEIETDGPNGHWEGLTLFLYNPASHQWSQSFINSKVGELGAPLIGAFTDGRGELFSQDTFKGRAIMVRGVWSDISSDSHRYEESYSQDGGRTWAPAFIASLTRAEAAVQSAGPAREGPHDFDFDVGKWRTHSSRLLHPLTGSTTWTEMDGVTVVHPIWGGRANLAEYQADGPAGRVELLSLRWYNPAAQQWNLDFATPKVGTLGTPNVGGFRNGRGDFYDQEPINGRAVLVRFSIWEVNHDTARSEQAFSADGGKTWETNWITTYSRLSD